MAESRKEFLEELIKFYKFSVLGTAESVEILANIEKEYPESYNRIKEATTDPNNIEEILASMSQEEKDIFILIFTKSAFIANKLNNLFDIDANAKIKLSNEIKQFVEYTEKQIRKLEEISNNNGESD